MYTPTRSPGSIISPKRDLPYGKIIEEGMHRKGTKERKKEEKGESIKKNKVTWVLHSYAG